MQFSPGLARANGQNADANRRRLEGLRNSGHKGAADGFRCGPVAGMQYGYELLDEGLKFPGAGERDCFDTVALPVNALSFRT